MQGIKFNFIARRLCSTLLTIWEAAVFNLGQGTGSSKLFWSRDHVEL